MPDVTVPWCGGELKIPLPDRWKVQQVAEAEISSVPSDWPQRLAVTLDQPGTGQPLSKLLQARPKGRIAVVVEDVTRRGPLAKILEVLMREISFANIPTEQIEIFFATGMHPPMMVGDVIRKLGLVGESLRWRCNDSRDNTAYESLGRIGRVDVRIDRGIVRADLRIIVSSVSPHFQAGFGGGYRLVIPGCAHIDTIRELNRLGMDQSDRQLVGTDSSSNVMRSVIDAGGVLMDQNYGKSFAVQYLLDSSGQPASISAGEVIPTQRMLAKQCSVACGIVTETLGDVLITNAYPRDFDLAQSLKSIAHTRWAVHSDGVIVCLTPTDIALRDLELPFWPFNAKWTRHMVRLVGVEAVCSLARRLAPVRTRDAWPYFRWACGVLYRNPIVMFAPALYEANIRLPGIKLVGTVEQIVEAVEQLLPSGTLRTAVFPTGGSTFPIV